MNSHFYSRSLWKLLVLLAVLLALLALASPVWAGGWAVVTLDSLPGELVAGEPVTLGFMVRQHGVSPMSSGYVYLKLEHAESGEKLSVKAVEEGGVGHYVASFTLPEPGVWQFGIVSGLYPEVQAMPDLTVLPAASTVAAVHSPNPGVFELPGGLSVGLSVGLVVGLAIVVASLLLLARSRNRWAVAGLVVGLLVTGSVWSVSARQPERAAASQAAASGAGSAAAVDGEDLFLAKGCAVCHAHSGMKLGFEPVYQENAPDLGPYTASEEFLHTWLKDPASIRPNTQMPNLELKEWEIEALITFINQKQK